MKTSTLILRAYRVKPHQDKKVKKLSRKRKISESEVIRTLIEKEDETIGTTN
jgi:hypothetical protein